MSGKIHMSNLTVEKLSLSIGITADKLLDQMSKSGLKHTSDKELVTEEDRKILDLITSSLDESDDKFEL